VQSIASTGPVLIGQGHHQCKHCYCLAFCGKGNMIFRGASLMDLHCCDEYKRLSAGKDKETSG